MREEISYSTIHMRSKKRPSSDKEEKMRILIVEDGNQEKNMKNKRKPDITEDLRKELTMVKNSACLLLALINDVIYVSKEETRRGRTRHRGARSRGSQAGRERLL